MSLKEARSLVKRLRREEPDVAKLCIADDKAACDAASPGRHRFSGNCVVRVTSANGAIRTIAW